MRNRSARLVRITIPLLIALVAPQSAGIAASGTFLLEARLTAETLTTFDDFGYATALSADGKTAAITEMQGSAGSGNGAVSVYVRANGWVRQARLMASDGVNRDWFGTSAAISADGSTIVIGAPGVQGSDPFQPPRALGAAYIFVRNGATWSQQAKLLTGGTDNAALGNAVAIDATGDTVLLGAEEENTGTGAAYVFVRGGGSWSQQARFALANGTQYDRFGIAVAISGDGNTAMIGDPEPRANNDSGTGVAYIYARSGAVWGQPTKLTRSNAMPREGFGGVLAMSRDGNTAIITWGDTTEVTGRASIFVRSGATWNEGATLAASDKDNSDEFGRSVALNGDGTVAAIGARYKGYGVGAAYVFSTAGGTWAQQAEMTAGKGVGLFLFGQSVSISGEGTTVIVGSPWERVNGVDTAGAAYFYTVTRPVPVTRPPDGPGSGAPAPAPSPRSGPPSPGAQSVGTPPAPLPPHR